MNNRSASGQILVLVLLVVLVALTIGLSIASRTLSTLRNTAELDQSNRAFSAAEAGIERALALLKTNPSACIDTSPSTDCSADISGVNAKVTVTEAGGTDDAFGVSTVDKDDALQVNLAGYSGNLDLYWGNQGDNAGSTCPNASAVVVSVVYRTSSGAYGMGKGAFDACLDAARAGNNFDRTVQVDPPDVLDLQDGETRGDYGYKITLNLTPGGPYVTTGSQAVMARVRLMYVGDKPIAFDPNGNLLPVQGQQIVSTAVVGGKQRTVKVLKTTSSLPAIFDYALFNGSTSPLTK